MNYQEIENINLTKNIYLLRGDTFLVEQAKNKIAQNLGVSDLNISEFNDENFEALSVINACNQFSFFEEKRIVFVSNLNKELSQDEKNIFLSYEKNPNVNCVLLIANSETFEFLKNAENIECEPSEQFLQDYVKQQFEKNNKKIDIFEIKKLCTYCLNDVTRINIEIKKICDYLQESSLVTDEVIEQLVFKDVELKVFDFTSALGSKNKQKAHEVLCNMLKAQEPPIKILGLVSNHFRRMFFAKINKGTNADLAKQLNCKEYAIVKAKQQAQNFSAKELKDIQNLLLDVDYGIKSGLMTQENGLYYLLFKIVC